MKLTSSHLLLAHMTIVTKLLKNALDNSKNTELKSDYVLLGILGSLVEGSEIVTKRIDSKIDECDCC